MGLDELVRRAEPRLALDFDWTSALRPPAIALMLSTVHEILGTPSAAIDRRWRQGGSMRWRLQKPLSKYACLIPALAFSLIIAGQAKAATELEQRAAIAASTLQSFLANDFDQLESVSRAYRTDRSRTASGLWNLSLFYAGIEEAIENQTKGQERDASFDAIEEKTRKWVQDFPDSPTGHIAHSLALIHRAWTHRGNRYASMRIRKPGLSSSNTSRWQVKTWRASRLSHPLIARMSGDHATYRASRELGSGRVQCVVE